MMADQLAFYLAEMTVVWKVSSTVVERVANQDRRQVEKSVVQMDHWTVVKMDSCSAKWLAVMLDNVLVDELADRWDSQKAAKMVSSRDSLLVEKTVVCQELQAVDEQVALTVLKMAYFVVGWKADLMVVQTE